jgi:hypothetical protein
MRILISGGSPGSIVWCVVLELVRVQIRPLLTRLLHHVRMPFIGLPIVSLPALVAQWIERLTSDQMVVGSTPAEGTS